MNERIQGIHYATGEPVLITIVDGTIQTIRSDSNLEERQLPYIAPGLVDLQINGYRGIDFNTLPLTEKDVVHVTQMLWKEGVTSYYPTVITNSDEAIEEAVKVIAAACERNQLVSKSIAGIHVEGPFISSEDGPRGAHGREYVKAPDWELFQRWQEAAQGRIKMVTLSPEWPRSAEFIAKCAKSGVVVSIGHTAATPEQIQEAVTAGASMSTHLGNGAHLVLPRHPNYLWEQLAQDDLWTCLIADGFHLPEAFLKVAMKTKGSRAVLVSDAVYLSGLEPGQYDTHIGGQVVLTREGKLHMKENEKLLAGSARLLKDGVAHLVETELCSLQEAWNMASIRPALLMNPSRQVGLTEGAPADLVVFESQANEIRIEKTIKSGHHVYFP